MDNKLNVLEGALKNRYFLTIALSISICQVLFILFGGEHLQLQPLDASEWALSVGLGFISIPLGMAIRCIPDEPLRRAGEWVATKTGLTTATARVRNGLPLQWLWKIGVWIVSTIQAMRNRDTPSLPDERAALLAWQDRLA